NPFYTEGRRSVVVKGETHEVYDLAPRNAVSRLMDCIEWAELSHPRLFWGALAFVCIAITAFFAITAPELNPNALCVVSCAGFLVTELIIPLVKYTGNRAIRP
ncbi:MAG: hypothetical protein K5837_02545, partial [Candidatus Saccharibacteria bacterium]|nr:hypothetical protein [Candidatus Saccharibacteria bacterium]